MKLKIDRKRLVGWAIQAVSTPSFTGSEQAMGVLMRETFEELGLQVQWQNVEEGRPNVLGIWEGDGGGPTLMFNGHMDTSYSGEEPWLRGIRGFQPEGFEHDGRIYGLGISNMKGALACYVEAVRALREADVQMCGDLMIAAVSGEIEKTQWGEHQGAEFRGYAAGSMHLVRHGGIADMCILGEPTEQKVVLGHFGSMWARLSVHGAFVHTAFTEGRGKENAIFRLRDVLELVEAWALSWEEEGTYEHKLATVGINAVRAGFPWRVSRTPPQADLFLDIRVPPTMSMNEARAEFMTFVRSLRAKFPGYGVEAEVFVTAPGAEIAENHLLVQAIDAAHSEVFGAPPERDVTRWFSDASVLTRYGIPTVNYGTSSGLPDAELGENLDVDGLVKMAESYARAAIRVCELVE